MRAGAGGGVSMVDTDGGECILGWRPDIIESIRCCTRSALITAGASRTGRWTGMCCNTGLAGRTSICGLGATGVGTCLFAMSARLIFHCPCWKETTSRGGGTSRGREPTGGTAVFVIGPATVPGGDLDAAWTCNKFLGGCPPFRLRATVRVDAPPAIATGMPDPLSHALIPARATGHTVTRSAVIIPSRVSLRNETREFRLSHRDRNALHAQQSIRP